MVRFKGTPAGVLDGKLTRIQDFFSRAAMNDKIESLVGEIKLLEEQLKREILRKEAEYYYEIRKKKVRFKEEAKIRHKKLVKKFHLYLLESRWPVMITGPLIWSCLIPIAVLDLFVSVYQAVCFSIYGLPKVPRSDYVVIDRHRLVYLNAIEKMNCVYCGYANGILGYAVEIAARTEQHFCPIKHALRMKSIHNRYQYFFDYGDGEGYRENFEKIRKDFEDIERE